MAQIETDPAFRTPWAGDENDSPPPTDGTTDAGPGPATAEEHVTQDMIEATTPDTTRRPTKFMADLSKAMQAAAEASRDETMARFVADSKTVVEEIQAASTVEATNLRRRADDDVAAVREWSKAEIARIREETEARIAARKEALDGEIEASAAVVDQRIARVGATVDAFQADMDAFFERLMAEQDPTRIATMAETMPDPPDLAGVAASIAEPVFAPFDPLQPRMVDVPVNPLAIAPVPETAPEGSSDEMVEAEAALAARLDFAAAEAEALAFTGDLDDDVGASSGAALVAPAESEHPLAAPPADVAPTPEPAAAGRSTSRVVVLGLISVASIATFKRGLSRSEGVASVGVASGPDGEFVFTVEHEAALDLATTVTELPGFDAKITAASADTIEVTAHDPDTGD